MKNVLPIIAILALVVSRLHGAEPGASAFTTRLKELGAEASRSEEAFVQNEPRLKALADSAPTERDKGAALTVLVGIFRANTPEDWLRMKGYAEQALALNLSDADTLSVGRNYIRILEREATFPLSDQVRLHILRQYVRIIGVIISHPAGSNEAITPRSYINRLHPTDPGYAEGEKKMAEGQARQIADRDHNLMLAPLKRLNDGVVNIYSVIGRTVLERDLRAINAPEAVGVHLLSLMQN
jgi:hypothetical protein